MRQPLLVAALVALGASPLFAQTRAPLGPHVITPIHIACTDLPVTAAPAAALTVAGPHVPDGRESLGTGDSVVIKAGTGAGLAVGQRFIARRLQVDGKLPRPGEGYGALHTSGILVLTAVNDDTSIARIEMACDPVEAGDVLEPYVAPTVPAEPAAMGEPQFDDRAQLIFGVDRRVIFGDGDILSIDRGTASGVGAGSRFAIYRDMKNGLPLVHVGEAVVVEAGETTSKVVLVSVSDAVATGDIAVPRRTP